MPLLVSVFAFAVIFPLSPNNLLWPHPFVTDAFFCWFFAVTPITTVVALIKLIRNSRRVREISFKVIGWGMIAASILANGMVLARLLTAL